MVEVLVAIVIAVLVLWAFAGPYLGYAAGLAGHPQHDTGPADALRHVGVRHLVREPAGQDWLPALPKWLWPDPTPKTATDGPPHEVFVVRGIGTAFLDPQLRAITPAKPWPATHPLALPSTPRMLALALRTERRLGPLFGGAR